MKLIIVSLIFLAVPSLLIGIIGYQSAVSSLNTLGAEGLKTNVRMTFEMIEAMDHQVKAGRISLADAQEEVKEAILGKKDANGQRPINPRLNLGKHGFLFIINSAGVELAHPNFEGQDVWNIRTTDGVYSTQEVVKAANNGGGFATYEWPLAENPDVNVAKITYAEKDPYWNWIVCAGAYLPDFNAGAHHVLYILLITLGISLLAGLMVILIFSKKMTKPILQVAEHAKSMALGDYTQEPIAITRKDEIGELVLNFNIMKENQKKAEELLRQNEAFLQSVTTHMGEGLIVINTDGMLTMMNREAEQMLGWLKEECAGQNFHDIIHRKENGNSFLYEECLSAKSSANGEVHRSAEEWFMRKNGSLFPVSYVTSPLYEEGSVTGSIIVFRDISKQKEDQERIEYMAFHDDLTKLPNLRFTKEKLTQEMESQKPFALLVLDIDRFKHINEALGHSIGDLILESVANRLKELFPSDVFVGRLTGDEFAIIYPCLDREDEWVSVCKQIQNKVNEPLQVRHLLLNVSGTIGSALYPHHGNEGDELLKHANIALIEAQQQQVSFQIYKPSMGGHAFDRLVLENHLHHALQRNELRLVYQPQVDIVTGQIQGVEALIRWHHPNYGPISPAQFIPIAENTGLIVPIGEWVLQTACRQLKEWHEHGISSLCMAVNLSSRQFYSQDLIETIKGTLHETGLPPEALELEITESMMMNIEHATKTLHDLKDLGCKIAIDDFGTGYSSLNYLKHLPIDRLKIDQSFIRDLSGDEQDDAIISTIISMAQHLQLDIIAEGVETPEQQKILRKKQCTHVQGYLYSPPLAPEDFQQQWEQLLQKAKTI
ncbi:EAL domain-containing protein [Bacillus benzoevorans]|uniref:Diguanylate cyclase (GGDEF)-like protein/PAS domain S-box-containing protein n=2 Tax=Bacillus benzoevorans TaxID=1456 RepID=A0A7X0HVF7_9BACI|nr:diguanylate cyclase (GGDEF)-like protein/PAS domain S-box-containing protein [Bacillus benzoevorans]